MRVFFLIISLVFVCCKSEKEAIPTHCTYLKSAQNFTNTPPFNISNRIELVSYHNRTTSRDNEDLIKNGKFSVKPLLERQILTSSEIDSLFSILYNYKQSGEGYSDGADCYNPHHSIVF